MSLSRYTYSVIAMFGFGVLSSDAACFSGEHEQASCLGHPASSPTDVWQRAADRGDDYRECFRRADRVLKAWLAVIDPQTGLVSERYEGPPRWTVANAAADLYSSLVLIASFTDDDALQNVLPRALVTERQHALRIGTLPDDLDAKTLRFLHAQPSLARSTFGAAEWCRDGLLRITEALGPQNAWAERLQELAGEIMVRAAVPSRGGPLPAGDHEVDGELLQVLSRLHALTGDSRYRRWAERIGEHHLFEKPPQACGELRLRDHGGEIISGLSELLAMVAHAESEKAARYRAPLRELLDRVLKIGRNPDGIFLDRIDPKEGKVLDAHLIDTWGYIYNAHLTYDMATGENRYRPEIERVLRMLPERYRDHRWDLDFQWGSSDEYADAIESALVLHNRIRVEGIEGWARHTIRRLWAYQKPDGTVNREYDDGSFARTSILLAQMLAEGVRPQPWRDDLRLGAATDRGTLYVSLRADRPWKGRLVFDRPRSRTVFHLPSNYPRINELPEWYVVSETAPYEVTLNGENPRQLAGRELIAGLPVELKAAGEVRLVVQGRAP